MRLVLCMCALVLATSLLQSVDGKKVFTSRRKSGGSNKNNNPRRGGATQKTPPAPAPATPGRTDSTNSHFLAAERGASSQGSTNVQNRELGLFHRKPSAPEPPKQSVPQTNGPIGFDKVNSDVQRKSGPPAYPGGPAGTHGSAPNGPPPAYNPGYNPPGTGSHGGYDAPPAYPGRPVNAPPVYPGSNPSYGQRAPGQPGGGYPNQQAGYQQSGYPHQAAYPSQTHSGQQNFGYPNTGYPNTGSNFGYPNQGIGSYPGGGFGNSHQGGFGGNPYGGSPFGHSNSFGGPSFGSGNNHYGANNFGFSNSPGLFGGSHSSGFGGFGGGGFGGGGFGGGGYNNFGYHKKSRFGGLPIPIPIPIPIPMGLFGGWGGGHSRSHRELDTFLRNQAVNSSNNETTNVYILNNSTVTPCTTDQFIYDTLNVTVISCTAGNCTAIKVFVTTNTSGELTSRSAGLTMCLESNTTFSSFADNTNPIVSDMHRYWMKMCKELVWTNAARNSTGSVAENATGNVAENASGNVTENASGNVSEPAANITVKVSETVLNETVIKFDDTKEQLTLSTTPASMETSTVPSVSSEKSVNIPFNSSLDNSTKPINSFCETFDCSWIEMCLPPVEVVKACSPPGCNSTKMTHNLCVRIKMCKSATTPISTFATFNNSITRTDPTDGIMQANDVANLTLISYIPPSLSANCSEDSGDASCKSQPLPGASQEVYASANFSNVSGESSTSSSSTPYEIPEAFTTSSVETTSIDQSSTLIPS